MGGYGSSTGWLRTDWPIESGEPFSLTFHIQDMCDHLFDSEIIIDGFRFLVSEPEPGTVKLD